MSRLIYVSGSRVMCEIRRFIVEITPQVFISHASLCKMRFSQITHVRAKGWKLPKRATRHPCDCFGQLPIFRNITERKQSRRVANPTIITNLPNFSFLNYTLKLKQIFYVHVTVQRVKFLIIKPTRCTHFSNFYSWYEILHVSDSSSVHHQEFFTVHTAMVYDIQVC